MELIWVDAPKWVSTIVYLAVGWIGLLGLPGDHRRRRSRRGHPDRRGRGASTPPAQIVYARQRPDPNPAVFGYHEIFHVLVIAAAAAHFAAIAIYALPSG